MILWTVYNNSINQDIDMRSLLLRTIMFSVRTSEQQSFINRLPKLKMNRDEEVLDHVRYLYQNRQFIEECQEVLDFMDRFENYLLKRPNCTVAYLQCYYKLREMRLINPPFKHNLHRKFLAFLLDGSKEIRNEHLEKYLWFLFEENQYERVHFEEAASSQTVKLFEVYQYMNGLPDLPTWEPYLRVATMLKYLGHQVVAHPALPTKKTLERMEYRYFPYVGKLYSPQQMAEIRIKQKYEDPFLTMLCTEYIVKNLSHYDNYLQRVEAVELEKQYERGLDVMVWKEFTPFLDLVVDNHLLNGGNDQIQNHLSDLFFRLCEQSDINIEVVTDILQRLYSNPKFMYSRRSPIIERSLQSLVNKSLEDFAYFPADGYISLLNSTVKMEKERKVADLQKLICKRIEAKLVWDEGQVDRLREVIERQKVEGGSQVLAYLSASQVQR